MKSRDSEDIALAVLKENIRFVLNGGIEDEAASSFCIRILAKKQEIADVRGCYKGDDIMQWYEEVLNRIDDKKIYCHKELMDELRKLKTDLSESTYHWAISGLVRDGGLTRLGYDSYSLSSDIPKDEYVPVYSETAERLIRLISEKYPYVQFTVFETVLMNEFLNHLIAQNTVFIQVEKESSIYVFRYLQDQGIQNVMYKPSKKDINLYWAKDSVIVTDMISEAPIRMNKPHYIMLEKMLVDMSADKLIATTFSKAELPDVYEQAQSRYLLDRVRMLRYARRRNRQDVLLKYLEEKETRKAILDMFPHTADIHNGVSGHVESVVLMSKVKE